MRSSRTIRLQAGLWVEGIRHVEATLRPLNGLDEETLGDAAHWPSPAARTSALLAATLSRIGSIAPVGLEHVRALSVLDRDVALIALRQIMFGDRIQSTVICPNADCGKPVDLDVCLSDLPIPVMRQVEPLFEVEIAGRRMALRPVNGGDQEAVAHLARTDPVRAEQVLLERCLVHGGEPLSEEQRAALRDELAHCDPQLENELGAICPECRAEFAVTFDIQDFLLQEISLGHAQLYRQVHTLAWYYHWSESEILSMPRDKRRTYLDLLSEALTEAHEALA